MTATTDPTPARRSAPRWMIIVLLVSLALNLLVAGMVAAAAWRFRHGGFAGPSPVAMGTVFGFATTLPPERRQAIWRQTSEERRALRTLRTDVRAARAEVEARLAAEPFDAARFAEAQARLLAAETRARTEAHKMVLSVAKSLTADERAALARWQSSEGRGKGPRGFWRRPARDGSPESLPPGERPAPAPEAPK